MAPEPSCSPHAEADGEAVPSNSTGEASTRRRWLLHSSPRAVVVAALTALALASGTIALARHRASKRRHRSGQGSGPPRIPLRELVRFREQQWFLEELENSRDGDPNAMLRLAKMYLYGQGCERNVNIAQEWLRRARAGGVFGTLDELLTAEDLEAFRRAGAAQRQQLRQQHAREQQLQQRAAQQRARQLHS